MTTVTLETLRADWKRVCLDQYDVSHPCGYSESLAGPWDMEPDAFLAHEHHLWPVTELTGIDQLMMAATTYVIARDYGLNTAMAWKLSDGAVDPRKGGEA